jgi:hypothetical protein
MAARVDLTPTHLRDQACDLACQDTESALQVARQIDDPWFRCQALAWIGRFASEDKRITILDEAINVSRAIEDPYRSVAVSAWPLRAFIELGETAKANTLWLGILGKSDNIENPVSRSDALFLLWQSVFDWESAVRQEVQQRLLASCRDAKSWKSPDTLKLAAFIRASESQEAAIDFVRKMPEGKAKRSALSRIEAGEQYGPRPFFWIRDKDGQ